MYYKNKDVEYNNYCNIIQGFPKYFKVFSDGFRVIDTYDLVSVPYYQKLDVKKLVPIDKEEWDIVEDIVSKAYQKRRNQFFCD
jgi:hypothetical protein